MGRSLSSGRTNVIPFVSRLEQDCTENLRSLCERAKILKLVGFEEVSWGAPLWTILGGRLVKITGKNCRATTLNFNLSPKLGGAELSGAWAEVAKALFILRFHRRNQAVTSRCRKIRLAASAANLEASPLSLFSTSNLGS